MPLGQFQVSHWPNIEEKSIHLVTLQYLELGSKSERYFDEMSTVNENSSSYCIVGIIFFKLNNFLCVQWKFLKAVFLQRFVIEFELAPGRLILHKHFFRSLQTIFLFVEDRIVALWTLLVFLNDHL